MTDPAIATAADYADALLTARRAKNLLVLLVLLMLLIQLGVFFAVKYTGVVYPMTTSSAPTTAPSSAPFWQDLARYAIGASDFIGVAGTILLALVLYLIVQIMVVGRLIGVSRVIAALIWTFVVLLLVFPWQAFLRDHVFTSREWMLPGVLYTWDELINRVTIGTRGQEQDIKILVLHWARFVAWPLVAVILLLSIQVKSNRGLRQALGEEVFDTSDGTPPSVV
ncbi:MAG: hypothetical protein H7Z14_09070 [Anaerolineae bacterium]|nr:hypothetical protein [Phycisphaerae bacterium]